jgi:uncharacterized protein (TIGR02268 family)
MKSQLNRLTWCVMLLLLVGASGEAAPPGRRKPRLRTVTVAGQVAEVRVAANTSTRLRFDAALDASRTRLVDGGERFEPLVVGSRFLVITPREDLSAGERVPLVVTLRDGSEVPLVLAADSAEVDVQVQVTRSVVTQAPAVTPPAPGARCEKAPEPRPARAEWMRWPGAPREEGAAGALVDLLLRTGAGASAGIVPALWRPGAGPEGERRETRLELNVDVQSPRRGSP